MPDFFQNFLARREREREDDFGVLKRGECGEAVFVVDDDHGLGGKKPVEEAGAAFPRIIFFLLTFEPELKQVKRQDDEYDLIEDE